LGFDENFDLGALAIVVKGVLASVRGVNRCGGKDSEGEGCCQVVGGGAAGCVFFGRILARVCGEGNCAGRVIVHLEGSS
jgi:hypothetical protein